MRLVGGAFLIALWASVPTHGFLLHKVHRGAAGLRTPSARALVTLNAWGILRRPKATDPDKASGGNTQADPLIRAKVSEFNRGGVTANDLVVFLKSRVPKSKTTGVELEQIVHSAAETVSDATRSRLLLEAYEVAHRSAESASFKRFGGSRGGALLSEQYMLKANGQGPAVSSGKSGVFDAVRVDGKDGPLKAKLSRNLEAMRRESENMELLQTQGGRAAANSVIRRLAYLENYDGRGNHAIITEAGQEDLAAYVKRKGPIQGRELKRMCNSVLNVLEGLSRVGLSWTDLRPENCVLVGGKVKAIDLESAVPMESRPVDCTPETTPPEVARLYVTGRLAQARVDARYDVWSFGVFMLYLASGGKTLYEGDQPGRIMQDMATLTPEKVAQRIEAAVGKDARLCKVLKSILIVNPEQRPTVKAVKGAWFFKSPL